MSDELWKLIPDAHEIGALPQWARVAFAARCARRVQPIIQAAWANVPQAHVAALERAITLAERSAAEAACAAHDATIAAREARRAAGAARAAHGAYAAAYYAAIAATYAAHLDRAHKDAAAAADAAADAAYAASIDFAPVAAAAIRSDFEMLLKAAKENKWGEDTPVPPEFFGPIWLDGEPEGWPVPVPTKIKKTKGNEGIQPTEQPLSPSAQIAVVWDPELITEDEYKELVTALASVVQAEGGAGLQRLWSCGYEVKVESGVRV